MLRIASTFLFLVILSVVSTSGRTADPLSGPPDFRGVILTNHHPDAQTILMSVESGAAYKTEKIIIHINDIVEVETLAVGQTINVWMGDNKAVMESMPPQAVAKKIVVDQ